MDVTIITELLGKPYNPIDYNCWHLVREVQQRVFGRDVPCVQAQALKYRDILTAFKENNPADYGWGKIIEPVHGAVVMMAKRDMLCHAGVYLDVDGGLVIHNDQPFGVTVESPLELRMRCWGDLHYFNPIG